MAIHARSIRRAIMAFAILLLLGLALLKSFGIERQLMLILVIASGLLVGLLLITYRAFIGVVEAANRAPRLQTDDKDNP